MGDVKAGRENIQTENKDEEITGKAERTEDMMSRKDL